MTTVFLTGFPGFLGTALVERLLDRYTDATVTCLIQSKYRKEAEDRAAEIEADDGGDGPEKDGRIKLVEGDITRPNLGLGDSYEDLQSETVEVYHLAAIYDLTMDRGPGKAVNIEGTRNMLEFAEGADDLNRFQYVSTVVVAGTYEGRFTEEMLQEGQQFANYYESTKHMAEVLVRQRMDEIPTTIYRPGVAVGDSVTGKTQKYDGPYAFVEALANQGDNAVIPAPRGASTAEFNVVPRDYIVDSLAYLSSLEKSEGKTYHLVDPDPPTTTELVASFGDAMGKSRTVIVPYPKGITEGLLASLRPKSDLLKSGGLHYQTWPASFDSSNTLEDLEGSGIGCPQFEEYVGALVSFYRERPNIGSEGMN